MPSLKSGTRLSDIGCAVEIPFMENIGTVTLIFFVFRYYTVWCGIDDLQNLLAGALERINETYRRLVLSLWRTAPIHVGPDSAAGPDQAKDWSFHMKRVQVTSSSRRRHSVLAIGIFKHLMNRLFILPEGTDKLERWCFWGNCARSALETERRTFARITAFRDLRVPFENLKR
jgi:hypothetical protein